MIKVLFFASLREKVGCDSMIFSLDDVTTVAELKKALIKYDPQFIPVLEGKVLSAVNQELVNDNFKIPDDAEVAFFPPVTGG
ncbi:molybdopterin converting factor subunit 1 [Pleionea sediminis]|uniref:molybdopterin converting factor subunit 1 n=1 Tax=Pleionea sediminis TaxID=2569479 RepID=UPI001184DD25|nr:molybdopterin converting factor subunit 1 [Pleionea sediminis]